MDILKTLLPPIIASCLAAIVTVLILEWMGVESPAIYGGAAGGAMAGIIASRTSREKKPPPTPGKGSPE